MKRVGLTWALALLLLALEGAAAGFLPRAWLPDVSLLLAVACGLHLPGATGLVAAWGVGWTTDVLAGSPLGHYALMRLLVWAVTRAVDRQIHLRRPALLAGFVALVTAADWLGQVGLEHVFGATGGFASPLLALLGKQVVANAIAAPFIARGVELGLTLLATRSAAHGAARLATRSSLTS